MKKTLKHVCATGLLLVLLMIGALPLQAAGQNRVVDEAGLFTAAEAAELEAMAADAIAQTGVDFAIITTNGKNGLNDYDYGEWFYETYGYGVVEQTGGFLFIIDMGIREFTVMGTGSVEKILQNGRTLDKLLDKIYDGLNRTYYANAARVFLQESMPLVLKEVNPWKARLQVNYILLCLLVGFVVSAAVVGVMLLMHKNSLPKAPSAHSYFGQEGVRETHRADIFIGTHTSRVPIPRDPPPGSGGGGGGGGRSFSGSSGGGRSFSGGSRKF